MVLGVAAFGVVSAVLWTRDAGEPTPGLNLPPGSITPVMLKSIRDREPPPDSLSDQEMVTYITFAKNWGAGRDEVRPADVDWLIDIARNHNNDLIRGRVMLAAQGILESDKPVDSDLQARLREMLITHLADPSPWVQSRAAFSLVHLGGLLDPEMEPALMDYLRLPPGTFSGFDAESHWSVLMSAKEAYPDQMSWWEPPKSPNSQPEPVEGPHS